MTPSQAKISPPKNHRSFCPIACTLDIMGDKWTLLIIRDLFLGKHRYSEFQASPEAIPTNILAERLKRLESMGLVIKEYYQDKPPRAAYYLTRQGAELGPILRAMREWGSKHVATSYVPPEFEELPLPEIRE